MELLLVLAMVTACVAVRQDLSGKMFTFPVVNTRAYVKLTPARQDFSAVTVCHRSFTDLRRSHALFSMATQSSSNAFLIFWDGNSEFETSIRDTPPKFGGLNYEPNMWHSLCTTWDSTSGLVQLWFDGQPCIQKFVTSGSNINGRPIIMLGQEQDSYGGGFDQKQTFIGMMSDVHMWDYVLSPCEIQSYMDEQNFTPGNVLNWRALDFQIVDTVLIEDKRNTCH